MSVASSSETTGAALTSVPPLRDVADLDRAADRLADRLVAASEGIDAVGVAVALPDTPLRCRVATDPLVRDLLRLERSTGEGPCADTLRSGRPLYVERGQLGGWPTYAAAALARGVRVQACAPLGAGSGARGVLTAYGLHHGDLDARSRRLVHDVARALGARVGEMVARQRGEGDAPAGAASVPHASQAPVPDATARRLLDRAVGIVQERYATSAERALELLEGSAARQHVDLDVVARHVVEQAERWGGHVPRPRAR